ncbi:MAG: hypothetical protein ABSG91_20920 [Syntrophobacteraceae bacterium]
MIVLLAWLAVAGAAKAQDAAELTRTFDEYNFAAKAGEIKKMLSLRTVEQQKEINSQIVKKQDRDYFMLIARAQTPESYEVQHVARGKSGQSATLYLLAQFPAMREIDRPRTRMEEMISFKKENGKWKMDSALPLGDPDKVKHPKDLTYDPKSADMDVSGEIGGRIVKTEFYPGYTLVLLRVLDEEHAVFLPAKERLQKSGMPLEELDPWNVHEFSGHPHKTDKQKFFATGGQLIEN